MSANLARTADGWWVVTPAGLVPLGLTAATTARLLADRPAVDHAVEAARAAAAAARRTRSRRARWTCSAPSPRRRGWWPRR